MITTYRYVLIELCVVLKVVLIVVLPYKHVFGLLYLKLAPVMRWSQVDIK